MPRVCPQCGKRYPNEVEHCPDDGQPTFIVRREEDLIGQTVDGRFTVRELLGIGGMGAVYRAYQHSMDRDVALKVMRADAAQDEQAIKRFFREARAASKLSSPHTITVFDFGQTQEGMLYIAMELLQGRSLARELKNLGRPMEVDRAVRIVDQMLDSLDEAHAKGILHRDLKPDNIFLVETRSGEDFVKVLDFGIAKIREVGGESLTATGMAFGTPTYMSPEQAQAKALDARSDLYSVGVIFFEMLAGKPPFEAETPLAMALKKVQEKAPTVYHVNPDVRIPEGIEKLLARLLDSSVEARPKNAAEVRALLAEAAKDSRAVPMPSVVVKARTTELVRPVAEPVKPTPEALEHTPFRASAPVRPRRKVPVWAAVLGILLVATAGLGIWYVTTSAPAERAASETVAPAARPQVAGPTPPPVATPAPVPVAAPDSGPATAGSDAGPSAPRTASQAVETAPGSERAPAAPAAVPKRTVRPGGQVDSGVERLLKGGRLRPGEDTIRLKGAGPR